MAPSPHGTSALHKSRVLAAAIVLVPLFLIGFVYLLVAQQQRIDGLKTQLAETTGQLRTSQGEAAFYKASFMTAMDDIRTVSKAYGGDDRYHALADELQRRELAKLVNISSIPAPITLQERATWLDYVRRNVVSRTCLQRAVPINTYSDDVLLSVTASGENSTIAAYVDGTLIGSWALSNSSTHHTSVAMPPGIYEVTFVSKSGAARIERVSLDTAEYPLANATRDYGTIWRAFDCVNASRGSSLTEAGAVRFLVEKQ